MAHSRITPVAPIKAQGEPAASEAVRASLRNNSFMTISTPGPWACRPAPALKPAPLPTCFKVWRGGAGVMPAGYGLSLAFDGFLPGFDQRRPALFLLVERVLAALLNFLDCRVLHNPARPATVGAFN